VGALPRRRMMLALLLLVVPAAVVGLAIASPTTIRRVLHPDQAEREQVEEVGRRALGPSIPAAVFDRARVEVDRTDQGWQVLFHDAWVSCELLNWPDACGMATLGGRAPATPSVYRDLRVCVAADGRTAYEFGASPRPISAADFPCRPATPPAVVPTTPSHVGPTATPAR
jgi:hypothetical protein